MRARVLVAVLLATAGLSATAEAAPALKQGSLTLKPCTDPAGWWCGSLPRALDPAKPKGTHIGIDFRWLPPSGGKARGPALVAVEGGPGYPSTGSYVEYTGIYGPLRKERGLLLVDNRGTGTSDLIDCPAVQKFGGSTATDAFPGRVARCARQLERRYPNVSHPEDLFATAYAANDLSAVMRALKLGKVDLYGDSYGTFFVQSFISRHQNQLNSVILDSAYPVRDLDPWYASSGETAQRAMDAVCSRDAGCAAAAGSGSATARLGELLARLRLRAISGNTRDSDGSATKIRVGAGEMVDLVQDAGSDPIIYRELDAAVRAALAGDTTPLLRLVAQSGTWDHGTSTADYFSNGLYWAVACTDYPQLFSMAAAPAERRAQLAAALPGAPATAFSPFGVPEWLGVSAYTQPYQGCLDWPAPAYVVPAVPATPAPLPASVPLLVVGGDLDSLTPLSDAQIFARTLGATTRVVTLTNTVHVTSEGDNMLLVGAACARRVIRAFVRAPAKIATLDASCAADIPPIHTPGAYPVKLAGAAAATVAAGSDPGESARRAVTVAAGALADATIRRYYSGVGKGPGLRGGTFTVKDGTPLRFTLRKVRFARDATVSGTGTWRMSDGAIRGTLTVKPATGAAVRVKLSWRQRSRLAIATVGQTTLSFPAP